MIQKHIGRISNTDQRVVVAYMLVPNTTDRSLVIELDSLPDRMSQVVRDLLESSEGQGARDLAEVLGRRMFEDTGRSVLQVLHEMGKLQWVPIDNVTMYPSPNHPYPLRSLLQGMGMMVASAPQVDDGSQGKHNQFTENRNVAASEDMMGQARGLLAHADILQQEADLKRAQAYRLVPSLAPMPTAAAQKLTQTTQATPPAAPVLKKTTKAATKAKPTVAAAARAKRAAKTSAA